MSLCVVVRAANGRSGFGVSASSTGFRSAAGSNSSAFGGASWTDNASEPFGRVESTQKCFACNGEVATLSKWTPPKPPSRPLFQSTQSSSLFHSNAGDSNQTAPLFGNSTQHQSHSLFGSSGSNFSGTQTAVSGGGVTFGYVSATTTANTNSASAFSSAGACFGGSADFKPTSVFSGTTGPSALKSGFGGTGTVFSSSSSTAKPPLAPSSTPFAASTSNPFTKSTTNPFATQPANPFVGSTSKPIRGIATKKFMSTEQCGGLVIPPVSYDANVNPFTAKEAPNLTVNPFASKVSPNATANSFSTLNSPRSNKNPFAVPGPAWPTGRSTNPSWNSTAGAGSALMKFKSGLRLAFTPNASPWGTDATQQQSFMQTQPALFTGFDWTGWEKTKELTHPRAGCSLKMPDVTSSEAESKSSSSCSLPSTTSSPSDAMVALPDTNPYGTGSFGAGLVEHQVKTAIANPPTSTGLKMLDARSSPAMPRQQPSARFAGRLGLARQSLQVLPMRPVQPRFPSRRLPTTSSPARAKLPQLDPFRFSSSFSRLAISKRALRIRVESSTILATGSPRKTGPIYGDAGEQTAVVKPDDESAPSSYDSDEESGGQDDKDTPSAACPVLLNNEYFTEPSVRELQQLTEEELSGVENFVIGRRGCGKVSFIGATDVRGLQLDELVALSDGEVVVYSAYNAKPAIGCALNKPAIVDLYGISAEESESLDDFLKRLKGHTQSLGATFLGYDEDSQAGANGVWSFRVEHF